MTQLFRLDPEPAGQLGDGTELVPGAFPWTATRVEWLFDFLPDDDLIHRTPVHLVSRALAAELEAAALTGYRLREATLTKELQFDESICPGPRCPTSPGST